MYLEGTSVFNNTEDIVVDAKVVGNGKIVLAGTGKVDFTDVSVFDGVIDVMGNENAKIGALHGVVTVTNSLLKSGVIDISGESNYGYFGSLCENVDISVSGSLSIGSGAVIPLNTSLGLAGGEIILYKAIEFATLSGHGSVLGESIVVLGDVNPDADGHGDAIMFESFPVFEGGLSESWSLHRSGDAYALRLKYGTTVVIR
jgi:hypothetical protein